jgi:hypothetical protein
MNPSSISYDPDSMTIIASKLLPTRMCVYPPPPPVASIPFVLFVEPLSVGMASLIVPKAISLSRIFEMESTFTTSLPLKSWAAGGTKSHKINRFRSKLMGVESG